MLTVGIDPGKKGGVVVLRDREIVYSARYTPQALRYALESFHPAIAALERVHAMPGQGVTSMFSFGMGYGEILGILYAFDYSEAWGDLRVIPPQRWKARYDLIGCDKQASIEMAQKLWPDVTWQATPRSRTPSDGMCEAALIALYAYEMEDK